MRFILLGIFLALALGRSLQDLAKCKSEPTLTGPCTNYTKKWYYSRMYKECIMFHYGGCGQTLNLFDSDEQCETLCLGLGAYSV